MSATWSELWREVDLVERLVALGWGSAVVVLTAGLSALIWRIGSRWVT